MPLGGGESGLVGVRGRGGAVWRRRRTSISVGYGKREGGKERESK